MRKDHGIRRPHDLGSRACSCSEHRNRHPVINHTSGHYAGALPRHPPIGHKFLVRVTGVPDGQVTNLGRLGHLPAAEPCRATVRPTEITSFSSSRFASRRTFSTLISIIAYFPDRDAAAAVGYRTGPGGTTSSTLEASSSRSQVHRSASRSYPWAGLLRLSMGVRGSPPTYAVIVTRLVTRAAQQGASSPRRDLRGDGFTSDGYRCHLSVRRGQGNCGMGQPPHLAHPTYISRCKARCDHPRQQTNS